MTLPLVLLAIPSVVLGLLLGLPFGDSLLHRWLAPIFEETEKAMGRSAGEFQLFGIDGALIGASVAVAAIGIVVAWRIFGVELFGLRLRPRRELADQVATANGASRFLYRASLNKWWFDDLNDLLFIRIGGRIAAFLWWFDRTIIDGAVNGVGRVTGDAGRGLRRVQTGRVQNYALGIALGLLVMAGSYLLIVGR